MEFNLETSLKQILDRLDVITNKWNSDGTRVGTLEDNQISQYHRNFLPRAVNPREHYDYNGSHIQNLQSYHDPYRQDDHFIRDVKVEAPSFVGRSDPIEYIDWESDMDHYFTGYEMSESRKVRFAQMKLLGQAKKYWQHVQSMTTHRRHRPIETWDEMKDKLHEKYVPASYRRYLPIRRSEPHRLETYNPKPDIHQIPISHPSSILLSTKRDDTRKETLEATSQEFSSNGLGHTTSQCPLEDLNTENAENNPEEEVYIADPELAEIYEQYETTQVQEDMETNLDIQEQEINLIKEEELIEEPTNDILICNMETKKLIEEPTNDILICNMETKKLIEEVVDSPLVCSLVEPKPSRDIVFFDQPPQKVSTPRDPFKKFIQNDLPNHFSTLLEIQHDIVFFLDAILFNFLCYRHPLNR